MQGNRGMSAGLASGDGPSIVDQDWVTEQPVNTSGSLHHLPEDEELRLRECAIEPIHLIDRVQSHGSLLGVDQGIVTLASADLAHWLGSALEDTHPGLWAISQGHQGGACTLQVDLNDVPHDVLVHRATEPLLIELESSVESGAFSISAVMEAIHRISGLTDPTLLLQSAAREIKALTGFDRVLGYRFFRDGHGQVLADEHEPEMEPYLGLHFPASDVPAQARALYVQKLSRTIADTSDQGVPLRRIFGSTQPVDLGASELRMASEHHLHFMRNMGQVATLSLSLVSDGELIGMFTCAHRSPRRVPLQIRQLLEVLARLVGEKLASSRKISRLQRQLEAKRRRTEFVAPFYGSKNLRSLFEEARLAIRDLIPCEAACIRHGEELHVVGPVPPADQILQFLSQLGDETLVTDSLARDRPDLVQFLPGIAGVIVIPLLEPGDCMLLFRGDFAREVHWLGDQTGANRESALSPRKSFSLWRESVTGRSLPWGSEAEEAFALGEEMKAVLTARETAELAELALVDALTGLPNRRFLDEHTDRFFDSHRDHAAAIFLDIDDFKEINDTHGHDAGDVVLIELSRRLERASRDDDIAVRLSGDEFVVLCHHVDQQAANSISSRLVQALAEPIVVNGSPLRIAVSAGVAMAASFDRFEDVLRAADGAMYQAKRERKQF
ncbi:diguanylate cyclase domain-containing protein [Leucobacter sp. W1478]|uniref:sensor domain-containing diguanylate cyclase n=1 Tax=Leucobacter sp. W1478 TaxID=3439065 RepID=UPI003F3D71C7